MKFALHYMNHIHSLQKQLFVSSRAITALRRNKVVLLYFKYRMISSTQDVKVFDVCCQKEKISLLYTLYLFSPSALTTVWDSDLQNFQLVCQQFQRICFHISEGHLIEKVYTVLSCQKSFIKKTE